MHVVLSFPGAVMRRFRDARPWFQPAYADGMHFMVCEKCNVVVPHWRFCIMPHEFKTERDMGCHCGHMKVRPALIPEYKAVWWLLVRGYLIRKLLLKKQNWDPRSALVDTSKHVNA